MKPSILLFLLLSAGLTMTSCVSKKKFISLQEELTKANQDLGQCGVDLNQYMNRLSACEQDLRNNNTTLHARQQQMDDLRDQLADCKATRDKQLSQVGDLTVLSKSANDNINETLRQLEGKDKYIRLLQAAKTKADSINLALSINLKTVLKDGIEDKDVEIKVDKTVVFINLSDKMLYESGSSKITSKADAVLAKIAAIIQSRPDMEVMVEGYTDNVAIKTACMDDNWDLSVKRATSVVRALQKGHGVDPNRLIAAGRGEWNTLAPNTTAEGRSTNRRTRIIIMPKLDQFYDLLNPNLAPK
ncbi:MAG: OmpA family protein [Saprospiraceae bacterium]|nr:OmpA family protein [Saprospiraceae bacterium]MCF8282125.1 OmpA family protein [Bacteroidales bacterium]